MVFRIAEANECFRGEANSIEWRCGGHGFTVVEAPFVVCATYESESGVLVQLRMDLWRKSHTRKFEMVAEKGQVHWEHDQGVRWVNAYAPHTEAAPQIQEVTLSDHWDKNEMYLATMKDFLQSVESGQSPAVSLSEGVQALETVMKMKGHLDVHQSSNLSAEVQGYQSGLS